MSEICILMGSQSDMDRITPVLEALPNAEVYVASAHRTPKLVEKIVTKSSARAFICVAGLAAHLPGVVASMTTKPVFGIPAEGNYEGLDALLSIAQMPPGIPVLSSGVNGGNPEKFMIIANDYTSINLIGELKSKAAAKCIKFLDEHDVPFSEQNQTKESAVNIAFVSEMPAGIEGSQVFTIFVPLNESSKANDALNFLKMTKTGFWVGLNRGENAAIAAIEVLNYSGKYDKLLNNFRQSQAKKVPGKISRS